MSRIIVLIGLLIAALLIVAPAAAQAPTGSEDFATTTDPISLIGSYYNAISRGEYDRAYHYWEQAPANQTEAQFTAGFSDTLSASALVYLPIYIDAGAGNFHAEMPTLVTAIHKDGTQVFFAGCFVAHNTDVPIGDPGTVDPNWYLEQGVLKQQDTPDLTALYSACDEVDTLKNPSAPPNDDDPASLLEDYFTQIAKGGGANTASFWADPTMGDEFETLYGQYANNAADIHLFVNPEIDSEGAAGTIYATVPALTILTGTDNVTRYVAGCYLTAHSDVPVGNATQPAPDWYLRNVNLTLTLDETSAINFAQQSCAISP